MPQRNAILDAMIRRLAALVAALVVASAPGAFETCQILCVSATHTHAPDAPPMGGHHAVQPSCHEMGRTGSWASADSMPCGHHNAVTTLTVAATRVDAIAPAPVHAVFPALPDTTAAATAVNPRRAVPALERLELRLSVPLRL